MYAARLTLLFRFISTKAFLSKLVTLFVNLAICIDGFRVGIGEAGL